MTREELIAYDKWLTRRKWGTGEIISPERAADIYLAEHSFPPAEGAETEETKELEAIFNLEQELNIPMKDRFHNSEKGKALFDAIYGKQQPTAEGAEEILLRQRNGEDKPITYAVGKDGWVYKMILRAMTEFATLHAQRIADKMVAENLVEFGNMIRDEPNGDIAALAEYFIRTINFKTREK